MWPNPQFPADFVTFTEEILNVKLHFLCSGTWFLVTFLDQFRVSHSVIFSKALENLWKGRCFPENLLKLRNGKLPLANFIRLTWLAKATLQQKSISKTIWKTSFLVATTVVSQKLNINKNNPENGFQPAIHWGIVSKFGFWHSANLSKLINFYTTWNHVWNYMIMLIPVT